MVFGFGLVYIYGLLLSPEPGRRYNKRAIIPLSQKDMNNSKYVLLMNFVGISISNKLVFF